MLDEATTVAKIACAQCSHHTVWPFQLDHHIRRVHCIQRNQQESMYDASEMRHYELEQYSCVCCNSTSHYKLGRYEHCKHRRLAANIEDKQAFRCDRCNFKCHSSLLLAKHLFWCRGETAPKVPVVVKITPSITPQKWIRCGECPYKTKTKSQLKTHMVAKHALALLSAISKEIRWLACVECPYRTKYSTSLKRHMTIHHSKADEIKWFSCALCPYRAKSEQNLKFHMQYHPAAVAKSYGAFKCTECDYKSDRKKNLKGHMQSRHAPTEDWFRCSECSYKTPWKRNFTRHRTTHIADDFRFRCPTCSFDTKRKGDLNVHMLTMHQTYDRIERFQCLQCPYMAKRKVHLDKHMSKHPATAPL